MKIGLDLAEILRISKLDWRDGEGKEKEKGRRGEILLCNGLIDATSLVQYTKYQAIQMKGLFSLKPMFRDWYCCEG